MIFGRFGEQAAQLAQDGFALRRLVELCRQTLSERGEAGGTSIARAALDAYVALAPRRRERFFQTLDREFAPDPARILRAAQAYAAAQGAAELIELKAACEPPRQELLRRLARAPGGIRIIVNMRAALLDGLARDEGLVALDSDFQHLLASWFNTGFLRLERVDWRTPALVLEQLIAHEAVHRIKGWDDLHRRLQADRRCFAFFHPVLPDNPLIFIEIALAEGMSAAIAPLIDIRSPTLDAGRADTAMFYSISNCEPGLRGVSLGNFLIKRVVDELSTELPRLKRFCTLSPMPGFAHWLAAQSRGDAAPERLRADLAAVRQALGAWLASPAGQAPPRIESLRACRAALERLCAIYLLGLESNNVSPDPVARFHLNNGARIERLNWEADVSPRGLAQSCSLMVNYVYEPKSIEANHERFVAHKGAAASRDVRRLAGT